MFSAVKNHLEQLEKAVSGLARDFSKSSAQAKQAFAGTRALRREVERLQLALGRLELRQCADRAAEALQDAEFSVFSQWGEDGIIQFLLRHVPVAQRIFIEFGIQDYSESNTRFLLQNDNWRGLVIDGSEENIRALKARELFWRHDLTAVAAFITRENINELFQQSGITGDIGILSMDLDGNDYWIWEAIEVVSPRIIIAEYNSRFGVEAAVTVPYAADFVRQKAHWSCIYYGASLRALVALAARKGYGFVGANSAGNNAFFVRQDLIAPPLRETGVAEGFRPGRFREARDEKGALAFLSFEQEKAILQKLPLIEITPA